MREESYELATSMEFSKEVLKILKIDHLHVCSVNISILPAAYITADICVEIPSSEFESFTTLLKKYQIVEISAEALESLDSASRS